MTSLKKKGELGLIEETHHLKKRRREGKGETPLSQHWSLKRCLSVSSRASCFWCGFSGAHTMATIGGEVQFLSSTIMAVHVFEMWKNGFKVFPYTRLLTSNSVVMFLLPLPLISTILQNWCQSGNRSAKTIVRSLFRTTAAVRYCISRLWMNNLIHFGHLDTFIQRDLQIT